QHSRRRGVHQHGVLEFAGCFAVCRAGHAPAMLLQYTGTSMATPSSQGHQADETWDEHYADERDAAWLYRRLASVDKNRERAELFGRPADVRDRHTRKWEELFRDAGRPLPRYAVARRTKLLAWVAKAFGPSS